MNLLEVSGLSAAYGHRGVLNGVAFAAAPGETIGLLGANGSGKTTLIKAVCGAVPHEGTCRIGGEAAERLPASHMARLCAYVPQHSAVSADLSVLDMVLMGFNPQLPLFGKPSRSMLRRAEEMLAQVGLAGLGEESYLALSEGQRHLCVLARALVSDARLLLLDEPESALDLRARERLHALLTQWTASGRTALLALHDPMFALGHCDRLLLLKDGRIAAQLCPRCDALPEMEQALAQLYGPVTLMRAADHQGCEHLVMLKEREEI